MRAQILALALVVAALPACRHEEESAKPPLVVEPTPAPEQAPAAEQAPPALVVEAPPGDGPTLEARALLDGLPSIEAACERIGGTFDLPEDIAEYDTPGCDAKYAHLVEDDWGMLVVSYEYSEYYFPLFRTEAGWSVERPVLTTWSSGAELNTELDDITLVERREFAGGEGEQLIIEIAATAIQSHFDNPVDRFERHRRKLFCTRERHTAWCAPAIISSIVVEEQAASGRGKPRVVSRYEPELRFEDGGLTVAGADAKQVAQRRDYGGDSLAYQVPKGHYSLAEVMAWDWPDPAWRG